MLEVMFAPQERQLNKKELHNILASIRNY